MPHLNNDWDEYLKETFELPFYKELREMLKKEYSTQTVYPPKELIFNALKVTSYKDTRVVILGQDPYHGEGQANGLSFSVNPGVPLPPSLRNIYKEIEDSMGYPMSRNGDLTCWAEQGVLLLNTVLTVRAGTPQSHQNIGWEQFTDNVLDLLNEKQEPVIFILWGGSAKKKGKRITNPKHVVLTAPHPSPLSSYRGFFGCNHFKKVNELLETWGKAPINWKNPS